MICARDLLERAHQVLRRARDDRGAAVGRVLAVARDRPDQDEADRVGDDRDERRRSARPAARCCCRRLPPPKPPNIRRRGPKRVEHRGEHREEARDRHDVTSRFAMCESSCARTPSTSCGSSRCQRPGVTATAACFGLRPVANAFGTSRVDDGDPRLRQVGHRAEPLDHRVQLGRLSARDDLRPGRGERELVGGVVLEEGDPDRRSRASARARLQDAGTGRPRRRRRAGPAGRS